MKKKFEVVTSILLTILITILLFIVVRIHFIVEEYEVYIYNGISINDIDVSNLTKEEAIEKIKAQVNTHRENRKIKAQVDEKNYEISYEELGIRENIEEIVQVALNYGKGDKVIDKYVHIRKGIKRNFKTSITLNEENFNLFLNKIEKEQNKSPINATIDHEWSGFIITPDEVGRTVDGNELKKSIKEEADKDSGNEDIIVSVNFKKEYPRIMEINLKSIDTLISSYTTSFSNSGFGRCRNIEIAANYIDNAVLLPGEEFSFNKIVGATSSSKGFEYAKVIKNGEFVDEIGGGVCQVSSTLYNAVLKSSLYVSERKNHSKKISYVPMGQDAMIAYGASDFKFVNTYSYPILIESIVQDKQLTFNIYTNQEEKGSYYEVSNEIVKEIKPKKEIIYDYGLSKGSEIIVQQGRNGYVVNTYKVRYTDGKAVEKILVGKSIYPSKNTVIKKGKN